VSWALPFVAAVLLPVEMAAIVFSFRRHGDDIELWLDEKRSALGASWNAQQVRSTNTTASRSATTENWSESESEVIAWRACSWIGDDPRHAAAAGRLHVGK
jgi:hypothetical protein